MDFIAQEPVCGIPCGDPIARREVATSHTRIGESDEQVRAGHLQSDNPVTGEGVLSVILLNGATTVVEQTRSICTDPNVCADNEHGGCGGNGVTCGECGYIDPSRGQVGSHGHLPQCFAVGSDQKTGPNRFNLVNCLSEWTGIIANK